VAIANALIDLDRVAGPPIFFGQPGATTATVVAFWALFYIWFGAEIWVGYRRRRLPSGAIDHDSGSKSWLIGSIWSAAALGIGSAFAFPDAAITSARAEVFIAGLMLMIAGLALRWYSIWVLGTSFTCEVTTRPGQEVVQSGPYRWVRHPSYTGGLITILGMLLCCANLASLAAVAVAAAGYAYRIRVEERALVTNLGSEYSDYMRRTKRLIPFLI
jgi:protein-S-isoprenylcysteine O-methyltransferase Ste14